MLCKKPLLRNELLQLLGLSRLTRTLLDPQSLTQLALLLALFLARLPRLPQSGKERPLWLLSRRRGLKRQLGRRVLLLLLLLPRQRCNCRCNCYRR